MKNILIHVKNDELIEKYKKYEKNGYPKEKDYSKEIMYTIKEFINNGYNVFLTSIDNFDYQNNKFNRIYNINNDKNISLSINELNELIDIILIRVIGSIEGNFDNIQKYLKYLKDNYNGIVLNNLKSMLKGMTKDYLLDFQNDKEYINSLGIELIPTKKYNNNITLEEIKKDIKNVNKYIIKPSSGELSNSVSNLSNIDENYLKRKENKVKGWIVQPIINEIWNGEYQMMFIGKELLYSQKKEYIENYESIPDQKNRILKKYNPTSSEIEKGINLIKYVENLYDINIDICRVDFIKNKINDPILLEFEMVNPGFFIGYMNENDENIIKITKKLRDYVEEKIKYKEEKNVKKMKIYSYK